MNKNLFPVPSKKALRKLGYLNDQKGIANRFLLEGGWTKHVERTKNFISESLRDEDFKIASILGSGWFLDVPIEFLLERFEKIYCYDINHPKQITHKYRNESKIEFIEADLTGGLVDIFFKSTNINLDDVPVIQAVDWEGIIISLNLLSQLDNLLFEYSNIEMKDENEIRGKIQESHLQFLSSHPYLLITDYEEVYRNDNGREINRKPTVYTELHQNRKTEKWTWEFDTHKTYKNTCTTELNIIAINNSKANL